MTLSVGTTVALVSEYSVRSTLGDLDTGRRIDVTHAIVVTRPDGTFASLIASTHPETGRYIDDVVLDAPGRWSASTLGAGSYTDEYGVTRSYSETKVLRWTVSP